MADTAVHVTESAVPPVSPPESLTVTRPWGQFAQYCLNEPVTVKIITVNAGGELSLQRHRRRSELWIALDPTIEVAVNGRRWQPAIGEEVWIPAGAIHQLAAPGAQGGRIMEVAFGHFDEDDIERLSDRYGRA